MKTYRLTLRGCDDYKLLSDYQCQPVLEIEEVPS